MEKKVKVQVRDLTKKFGDLLVLNHMDFVVEEGMAGFTLRPGRAVLEIQGKLYNPTPIPQTFLWWANPAVEKQHF